MARSDNDELTNDQTCQISDGPYSFEQSVVTYIRLRSFEMRLMFAYLREREMVLTKDVERLRGEPEVEHTKIVLQTVESILIWMAHNLIEKKKLEADLGNGH